MTNFYTVQKGDNLTKIAKAYNTTVDELVKQNKNITNPDLIFVGQKLSLGQTEAKQEVKPAQQDKKYDSLQTELVKTRQQLNQMQTAIDKSSAKKDYSSLEMLGYGAAGAAAFEGVKHLAPHVKSAAETGYLKYLYAKDGVKNSFQKIGDKVKNGVKHVVKKAELEYAFAKDAVKSKTEQVKTNVENKVAKTQKTVSKKVKKYNKTIQKKFDQSNKILDGKRIQINKVKIKPLGTTAKVLGRGAVLLNVGIAIKDTHDAYKEGGTKAAVKQGTKSAAGIATGLAGAKIGAAIGTAICPGIGTAIGGFVGGVAGYFAGEGLADKVISWFE